MRKWILVGLTKSMYYDWIDQVGKVLSGNDQMVEVGGKCSV